MKPTIFFAMNGSFRVQAPVEAGSSRLSPDGDDGLPGLRQQAEWDQTLPAALRASGEV
jgi:hypothetical protein